MLMGFPLLLLDKKLPLGLMATTCDRSFQAGIHKFRLTERSAAEGRIEELMIRLSLWYKPSNQTPSNLPSSDTSSLCHCGVEASSGRLLSYVILTSKRKGGSRKSR